MALIYGLIRAIAFALLKTASWKHNRAKTKLERTDKAFSEIENSCKAEEVASGRPANFASQFKLMKLYEARDVADLKWKAAANKLQLRQRRSNWLKALTGRFIPYAVGLIDMTAAVGVYQWLENHPGQFAKVADLVSALF